MQDQPPSVQDEESNVAPPQEPLRSGLKMIWQWLVELGETVLPAIVIAVLINLFLAQATRVYGSSMEPNLHTDQRLVVEKVSYRLHGPRRGDVVVLRLPERGPELLIKRVIGLPGETIEVRSGTVYINDRPLEEPYTVRSANGSYGPTIVPDDPLGMDVNTGNIPFAQQLIYTDYSSTWYPNGATVFDIA